MHFVKPPTDKPLILQLRKDLTRSIKRGHPWIYDDALVKKPDSPPGTWALLQDKKGKSIAKGFYHPKGQLCFRVCVLAEEKFRGSWVEERLNQAISLRKHFLAQSHTNAFRLINGEGDGLPDLIAVIYSDTAVLQLDGSGPEAFWQLEELAAWLAKSLPINRVFFKPRRKDQSAGYALFGDLPDEKFLIQENGALFYIDVIHGQKTGFFLDQRANRQRIRELAKNKKVLNLFGYSGGFSVCAGLGGATQVTTVDLAPKAIDLAQQNWEGNGLPPQQHEGVVADAFDFLNERSGPEDKWELAIVDPPSFSPAKDKVPRAIKSYTQLFTQTLKHITSGGLFCPSSCSSHITQESFLDICQQALSQNRRRGQVLGIYGQGEDHPFPMACPELRYLKFAIIRVS